MFIKTFPRRMIAVFLLLLLAACNGGSRTPAATPTPAETPVPPTATPTPAEIVWVSANPDANANLTKTINDFASGNSLQYRSVTSLDASQITSGTKIVVFETAPDNLSSLASASPNAQFVILGTTSVTAGSNVSIIQTSPADEAFMAGYLTMLIADDWRAAAIVPNDGPLGEGYADAFTNGARFVCGKCNPFYAPIVDLPQVASIPTGSDTVTNSASGLAANWLSSAFIDPAFVTADVVANINHQAFNLNFVALVTTDAAPSNVDGKWVARLSSDASTSLKTLLPDLLNGKGGQSLKAQIIITAPDEEIVSPAKQDLFNQVATELATGQLIPNSVQ